MDNKNILISAGETSGDMHAANLVSAIKKLSPKINFLGMGGKLMEHAGVDLVVNINKLKIDIIGVSEIIKKIPEILLAFYTLKQTIINKKPDLIILVDYPGFNLRLAKFAKKSGIKVLYFISPKIWAWNQKRIKIIKKYVDIMAVIFPFEVEFYKKFQVPVTFVGNPLLEIVKPKAPIEQTKKTFELNDNCKTIGLFPGSRKSEIKKLLPLILKTVKILKQQNPNLQFLLSQANSITTQELESYLLPDFSDIRIVQNQNYEVMQVCDAIIAASGTATLEIAILLIPLVIIYKKSWLEYLLAKNLLKIPYIGLGNIIAGKKIINELLQYDATPKNIAQEISKILNNHDYRETMINNLKEVKNLLKSGEQTNLAELIIKMLAMTSENFNNSL